MKTDLAALRRRVAGWRRRHGGKGSRVPEKLWGAAVEVARERGVYATARALRLKYEGLRDHLAAADGQAGGVSTPTFVEVQMTPAPRSGAGEAVVELVGRGGEQMRIHLSASRPTDLLCLAEAFWSRQS